MQDMRITRKDIPRSKRVSMNDSDLVRLEQSRSPVISMQANVLENGSFKNPNDSIISK